MTLSTFYPSRVRALRCLLCLIIPALAASAGARKPRRQENAPEIRAQLLQQKLADPTLSSDERAKLSVDLAIIDYRLKDFGDEVEVLQDALATGTTNVMLVANAHYYLGRAYEALGDGEQAIAEFDIVWQQYPNSRYELNAAMELGDLLLVAGDSESATDWYQTIISQQPTAKLAFLARDKLRAMTAGEGATEITDESHRPVYLKEKFRRLDQYLYSHLYDKADALANEMAGAPTNAAAQASMSYHLAHHYWMYGNADGADRFLAQSVTTTGDRQVQALILAGHVKRALGQMDAALGYYEQAIAAAPAEEKTITAYQQSVRLLLRAGRQADAQTLMAAGQQAFASSGELPAYLNRIAGVLRDQADPRWRDYAAQVAATATNEVARRALIELAVDARMRRDWVGVESFYRQAATRPSKSWRSNVDAQVRLLEAQLNQTNTVGATQTEQALLSSAPALPTDDARAYAIYRLGKIWLANGHANTAAVRWQQIVSSYPSTALAGMAQVHLATLAEAGGNLTNAVTWYQAFLSRPDTLPQYKLHAYANLIRLEQALGSASQAALHLGDVQSAALQSHDAELQLDIAQYLWQHSDQGLASQLLEAGLTNAEAQVKAEPDPHKRLRWEYMIARRLDVFGNYGWLAQRLGAFQPDLDNKSLDDRMRYATYYILIRALEKNGQSTEAQALCQKLISCVPDDSMFVGHILYRMSQEAKARGDKVNVRNLAITAFQQQPTTSLFAQQMYLETATEDYNAGNYADALAKAINLEQGIPMSPNRRWAGHFHWDCQYLKGRCLIAKGNATVGQQLVTEALVHKPVIPYFVRLKQAPGVNQ